MKRLLKGLVQGFRTKVGSRRERALRKAIAEKRLRESDDGTIWRSGKGGSHYGN